MIDVVKGYLLSKPEAWEDFPFGDDVSVIKVRKKMFATLSQARASSSKKADDGESGLTSVSSQNLWQMNLKCDPEQALMLRDVFPAVIPGYHMNKAHWNTVILDESIPQGEIERMIDLSFALVVRSFTKKEQQLLELHHSNEALYGST